MCHLSSIIITHFLSYITRSESVTSRLRQHAKNTLPSLWVHKWGAWVFLPCYSLVLLFKRNNTQDLCPDLTNMRNLWLKRWSCSILPTDLILHLIFSFLEICHFQKQKYWALCTKRIYTKHDLFMISKTSTVLLRHWK